jgi:hypothetical protein
VRDGGGHVSLAVVDRPAPLRAVRSQSLAVAFAYASCCGHDHPSCH